MNVNEAVADVVMGLLDRALEDDSDEMFDFLESMVPETLEGQSNFQDVLARLHTQSFQRIVEQVNSMFRDVVDMDKPNKDDEGEDFTDFLEEDR